MYWFTLFFKRSTPFQRGYQWLRSVVKFYLKSGEKKAMTKAFEYLKNTFPKKFREIVLEHQAVNKVITFCDDENQYLLFTGMFPEVNNGKGIAEELETYFVNFLIEKYPDSVELVGYKCGNGHGTMNNDCRLNKTKKIIKNYFENSK